MSDNVSVCPHPRAARSERFSFIAIVSQKRKTASFILIILSSDNGFIRKLVHDDCAHVIVNVMVPWPFNLHAGKRGRDDNINMGTDPLYVSISRKTTATPVV